MSTARHFAMKLTPGGGPPPAWELEQLAMTADNSSDGTAWLAARKTGNDLRINSESTCLAFAVEPSGRVLLLRGRILARSVQLPDDPVAKELYQDGGFSSYWQLDNIELLELHGLDEIPGRSRTGKRAEQTFKGTASFAYWILDHPQAVSSSAFSVFWALRHGEQSSHTQNAVTLLDRPVQGSRSTNPPLFGVDFSGGRESFGKNRKLWVASWLPDQAVRLECGIDGPGFGRRSLAERIARTPGIWVLDFPFGPAADVARAIGWSDWADYLSWASQDVDPTSLRNQARTLAEIRGAQWTRRRQVDLVVGTTWFPFFEQLYRQTILGARDVLMPLVLHHRDHVRILPWHEPLPSDSPLGTTVVEGFPGLALRNLGFRPAGYKGRQEPHRVKRERLLAKLLTNGLPVNPQDRIRVIEDEEGDALDALVLLVSAARVAERTTNEWLDIQRCSQDRGTAIEGWFFD